MTEELLAPVLDIYSNYTRASRDCPELDDERFLRLGVLRTISQSQSGRDFLQQQAEVFDTPLARTTFFRSLHSARRLALVREVAHELYARLSQRLGQDEDLLGMFAELNEREVWAADGHQIEHACHALRDSKNRCVSVNTLYLLCLHSGMLCQLAPVQGHGVYHHEMPIFRRAAQRWLRDPGRGRSSKAKPIFVLDPAFVDNGFWDHMRQTKAAGAVVVCRMKENMNPQEGKLRAFDGADPVNLGVDGDLEITFSNGILMRLVVYTDPETGECFHFLSTDFDLRPGVIAWLYFLRWRIEKVFDTSKNKLQEHKAWANGWVAQEIQAHFLAITHNLLVLFSHRLWVEHGIREEKLLVKREEQLGQRSIRAQQAGRRVHPYTFKLPPIIQLSLQLIRSVRNFIITKAPLTRVVDQFRAMLVAYL